MFASPAQSEISSKSYIDLLSLDFLHNLPSDFLQFFSACPDFTPCSLTHLYGLVVLSISFSPLFPYITRDTQTPANLTRNLFASCKQCPDFSLISLIVHLSVHRGLTGCLTLFLTNCTAHYNWLFVHMQSLTAQFYLPSLLCYCSTQ